MLFPYVRDLAGQVETCGRTKSPFGTVENPIRMMEREHAEAGDAMRIIRELTKGYRRLRMAARRTRSAWPNCNNSSGICTGTCIWKTTCCSRPPFELEQQRSGAADG